MTLTQLLNTLLIEGYDAGTLEMILKKEMPEYKFKILRPGATRIEGPIGVKVLGCITKYYTTEQGNKKMPKRTNSNQLNCHYTRKLLGIQDTVDNCADCHLHCMVNVSDANSPIHRLLKK